MSILDYIYSPTSGYVGKKIRDYVPVETVKQFDREKAKRAIQEHQFEDSIGGDSSNYKEK